jgi:membrane-associated phospholipid phosphatase
VKHFLIFVQTWFVVLAFCAVLTALSFAQLDVSLVRHFWKAAPALTPLNTAFGASAILTLESAVALGLILTRVLRGHISRFGEALAIACLASIITYSINDEVLKPMFGVRTPADVMAGARHILHWFMGTESSSFPSGHMVLAGAFAGAFMSYYRASIRPLSALLLLAAGLLIFGNWHFLSDVIAGAFIGISAGMLAGEAMLVQAKQPR